MRGRKLLWCVFVVLFLPRFSQSKEASEGLFSDKEADIFKYLEQHRIPHIPLSAGAGPTYNAPNFQREIDRALNLFKSGSTAMRLAIARQLRVQDDRIVEFWNACGIDDFEAKHYIIGAVLYVVNGSDKTKYLDWLINESSPAYVSQLLSHVNQYVLYKNVSDTYYGPIIELLMRLYRQKGQLKYDTYLGDYYDIHTCVDVQAPIIGDLPVTGRGRDVLLQWIVADSKKVSQGVLDSMWRKFWELMQFDNPPAHVPDFKEMIKDQSIRKAVGESWCIEANHECSGNPSFFKEDVWEHIFNPDTRVSRGCAKALVAYGPQSKEALLFIRTLHPPRPLRDQAAKLAMDAYDELVKERQAKNFPVNDLDSAYAELLAAIKNE